jgi:hypothetical protein
VDPGSVRFRSSVERAPLALFAGLRDGAEHASGRSAAQMHVGHPAAPGPGRGEPSGTVAT